MGEGMVAKGTSFHRRRLFSCFVRRSFVRWFLCVFVDGTGSVVRGTAVVRTAKAYEPSRVKDNRMTPLPDQISGNEGAPNPIRVKVNTFDCVRTRGYCAYEP